MGPIKAASITKLRQHPRQAAIMALVSGGKTRSGAAVKQSHPTSSMLVLAVDCRRQGKQVWDGWMRMWSDLGG